MARRVCICLLLLAGAGWGDLARAAAMPAIAAVEAAIDRGDAGAAQRLADSALRGASGGDRARLLLDRGLAYELLGSPGQALADFTAALARPELTGEGRAQALLQRGFLMDGQGRLNDAAGDYSAVIALKAGVTAIALNNRANIYRRQGRLADARRDYQAALAAGSDKPQYPYYGLGRIAEAQNDKDAARDFYAKAVAADPAYRLAADRLQGLGDSEVIHLHPPGAAASADRIVLKPPPDPGRIVLKPPPVRHTARPAPVLRPALDETMAVSAPKGAPQVQLGAWRSRAQAQAAWTGMRIKAAGVLKGLTAHIMRIDLPGRGTYFRLRVATSEPERLCGKLRGAGLECLRARD